MEKNINKLCILGTIILVSGLIIGVTIYKVIDNHNKRKLLVDTKFIVDTAKKCIYDDKCSSNEDITLEKLYDLSYLERQVNSVTKEYYNNKSYVTYKDNDYVFVDVK